MKKILLIICLLLLGSVVRADRVKVRLFSNNSIDQIAISFDLGTYNIYADDTILIEPEIGVGKSIELTPAGQKVHITIDGYNYGNHNTIHFTANDTDCILCLNPRIIKLLT